MWRSQGREGSTVLSTFLGLPGRKAVRHGSPEERSADEGCALHSSLMPAGRGGLAAGILWSYSTWEVWCFQFCQSLTRAGQGLAWCRAVQHERIDLSCQIFPQDKQPEDNRRFLEVNLCHQHHWKYQENPSTFACTAVRFVLKKILRSLNKYGSLWYKILYASTYKTTELHSSLKSHL